MKLDFATAITLGFACGSPQPILEKLHAAWTSEAQSGNVRYRQQIADRFDLCSHQNKNHHPGQRRKHDTGAQRHAQHRRLASHQPDGHAGDRDGLQ